MNTGNFAYYRSGKTEMLYIIEDDYAWCVVNADGSINQTKGFHLEKKYIQGVNTYTCPAGAMDILSMMGFNPYPQWVQDIRNSVQTPTNPATASAIGSTGFPIGSLILGTGKANNVWIINKDNSRDVSLLWDGKGARFCGSELERQDNLLPGHRQNVSINIAIDTINNKLPVPAQITYANVPQWAKNLLLTHHVPVPTFKAPPPSIPQGVAVAMKSLGLQQKEEKEQKTFATFQDTCQHDFREYVGIREIYEYCVHCDIKRAIKQ